MQQSTTFQKFVLLLFGSPAAGKFTIGKAVSQKYNAHLLDNHHFNNVIMPYVDIDNNSLPDICQATYDIRTLFFNVVRKHYKKDANASFIFTNVLIDDPMDYAAFDELRDFANDINACFVPIELVCDIDTLCQRVDTPQRAERFKLTDKEILKSFLISHKMANVQHPNLVKINVSNQTPDETTKAVVDVIETHIFR